MEKFIILVIVAAAIIGLVRHFKRMFSGEKMCGQCPHSEECKIDGKGHC